MAIIDLFSKRQEMLRNEVPDVYVYTQIPQPLRVQIVHILNELFSGPIPYGGTGLLEPFERIEHFLCREYGLFRFPFESNRADERVMNYLLKEPNHERVLDLVEVSFSFIASLRRSNLEWQYRVPQGKFDAAIDELNGRFREHGIGYQYEEGRIMRVDSQLIHSEIVKPALSLLAAQEYAGANAEFLKAFEHYRKGNTKESLNECLKAFESTMKAICTKHKWPIKETDPAKRLIEVCLENGLIPQEIQSHFGGLRATLESGIPTLRNRMGAHGQGVQVTDVPLHVASYMLHLTATTMQFLVESEKALK